MGETADLVQTQNISSARLMLPASIQNYNVMDIRNVVTCPMKKAATRNISANSSSKTMRLLNVSTDTTQVGDFVVRNGVGMIMKNIENNMQEIF